MGDEGHGLDVGGLVLAGPGAVEDGDGVADGPLPVVRLGGLVDGPVGLAGAVGVGRRREPVLLERGGLLHLPEVEGDDAALVGEVVLGHTDLVGVGVEALLEGAVMAWSFQECVRQASRSSRGRDAWSRGRLPAPTNDDDTYE